MGKLTGSLGWKITVPKPSVESDPGHVSLDGIKVISKVKLPVTSKVKEVKPVFAPKLEGVTKNTNDEIGAEESTILPRVSIS